MPRFLTKAGVLAALMGLCLTGAEGAAPIPMGPPQDWRGQGNYRPQGSIAISAYQRPYAMNFEVWRPTGLPAGWYATFDGFPVAQVAENLWVYGRFGPEGILTPTDVLVGSVVPTSVPTLARVAVDWGRSGQLDSPAFRKLRTYRCDTMGYLDDPLMWTVFAWNSQSPDLYVWLGNRWKRISPRRGEYTWQALNRERAWIIAQLRKHRVWGIDPNDLADLARQWGLLWAGPFVLRDLGLYREGGGNGENPETTSTAASPGEPASGGGSSDWDVD